MPSQGSERNWPRFSILNTIKHSRPRHRCFQCSKSTDARSREEPTTVRPALGVRESSARDARRASVDATPHRSHARAEATGRSGDAQPVNWPRPSARSRAVNRGLVAELVCSLNPAPDEPRQPVLNELLVFFHRYNRLPKHLGSVPIRSDHARPDRRLHCTPRHGRVSTWCIATQRHSLLPWPFDSTGSPRPCVSGVLHG